MAEIGVSERMMTFLKWLLMSLRSLRWIKFEVKSPFSKTGQILMLGDHAMSDLK